jgi:hypothetical protein
MKEHEGENGPEELDENGKLHASDATDPPNVAQGGSLRHDTTSRETLSLICQGHKHPDDVADWANSIGLQSFWEMLVDISEPNYGEFWSPRMALNWIRFGDCDKVNEASEKRLRVVGIWERRDQPLTRRLDRLVLEELSDLVGPKNVLDIHKFRLLLAFAVEDEKGRVPAIEKRAEPRTGRAEDQLWRALAAGQISATGLKNGASPRVEIPAREWMDLRLGRDCEASIPAARFARPDTLFAPDGQRYRRVLISADAVKTRWPVVEAATSNVAGGMANREAALQRFDAALLAEANQSGGTVSQQKGIGIAREIARDTDDKISRAVVRERIKALKLEGKQGRRKKVP